MDTDGAQLAIKYDLERIDKFIKSRIISVDDGEKLKSTSGWNSGGNGTDEVGFTALPGGYRRTSGSFDRLGYSGNWWSATQYRSPIAWGRHMHHSTDKVGRDDNDEDYGFSVRCIRDY